MNEDRRWMVRLGTRLSGLMLVLVSCAAESEPQIEAVDRITERRAQGAVGSIGQAASGIASPTTACDGSTLRPCDPGETGPTCSWACFQGETDCGFSQVCHADGRVAGLSTSRAFMFALNPTDNDRAAQSAFINWILGHPGDLGLASGLQVGDLGLRSDSPFRNQHDWLTFFRFRQEYRGYPVHGPDGVVLLETHPQGAVSLSGSIVDGRPTYDGLSSSSTAFDAEYAARMHVAAETGIPANELVAHSAARVAVPEWERICWRVLVHHGGIPRGMVLLGTDPPAGAPLLPLLDYDSMLHEALTDIVPIELIGQDPETVTDHLVLDANSGFTGLLLDELSTGAPLVGSTVEPPGPPTGAPPQLATERVVVLDLMGNVPQDDPTVGVAKFPDFVRITDGNGEFHGAVGTHAFNAQRAYWIVQSAYDFVHGYMAGRWDSARPAFGGPSFMPPGAFLPRIFVAYRGYSAICTDGSGCATMVHPTSMALEMGWPSSELTQLAPGFPLPQDAEVIGTIALSENGLAAATILHEIGHILDFFLGAGKADVQKCLAPCTDTKCDENTPDEARALTETIAQLWTVLLVRHLYPIDYEDACPLIGYLFPIPTSSARVHGPSCMTSENEVRLMVRPDKPECPTPSRCDKPSGDMQHFCDKSQGYRVASLMQAFWELANGRHCDPEPPFECDALPVWPPNCDEDPQVECATPLDLLVPAYAYALRLRPATYRQLVDDFVRFVGCNYGDAVFYEVNAVLCHHGATDCTAKPPVDCADCGNGIREGGEECDGQDWIPHASCETLGFDGGMIVCDECKIDNSGCYFDPVVSTGVSVGTGADDTGGTGVSAGDDGGSGDGGGCGCRTNRGPITHLGCLLALLGVRRRRTRAHAAAWAMALVAACGDDSARIDSGSTGPSSSASEETASTTEVASLPPEAWVGFYRNAMRYEGEPESFPFAVAWRELEIRDDGTCRSAQRTCIDGEVVYQEYECVFHDGFVRMRNFDGSPVTGEGHIYFDFHFTSECGVLHEHWIYDPEDDYPPPRITPWLRGRLCVVEACPDDVFEQDLPTLETPWVYDLCPGEFYDCPCVETDTPCGG